MLRKRHNVTNDIEEGRPHLVVIHDPSIHPDRHLLSPFEPREVGLNLAEFDTDEHRQES